MVRYNQLVIECYLKFGDMLVYDEKEDIVNGYVID